MTQRLVSHQHLRIFCVEDNPLIALHLGLIIEEAGHFFAGSSESFSELKSVIDTVSFDLALVDIDLADGRTGGEVARWLCERGHPSLFVTGQEDVAATYGDASLGVLAKPVTTEALVSSLNGLRHRLIHAG